MISVSVKDRINMSPREQGRYLRVHGWTSHSYAGVLGWMDPQNTQAGSKTTKEAFEIQKERDK